MLHNKRILRVNERKLKEESPQIGAIGTPKTQFPDEADRPRTGDTLSATEVANFEWQ